MTRTTIPVGVDAKGVLRLSPEAFRAHWAVDGATGCGKTGALTGLALSALAAGIGVTYLDPKGEAASDLLMFVAAGGDLPPEKVRVVAPYREDVSVRFGLLARLPGMAPPVQAGLATELVGRVIPGFGVRMQRLTFRLFLAGLLADVGLRDVTEALRSDRYREALAARVGDAETRAYLLEQLPRERSSADAVLARLEWMLRLPGLALALSSTQTLRDEDILPPAGLAIVDLGRAPMGSTALSDLFAQLALLRATSALFSREQGRLAKSKPAPHLLIIDEAQRVMVGSAAEVERILCESRSFHCGLVIATQSLGNRAFDAKFLDVLKVNVRHHLHLRPDEESTHDLVNMLPVTGRVRDPARLDRLLRPEEERRHVLEILRKCPDREGLLCSRGEEPRLLRTLGLPYQTDAERARRLPEAVRRAYIDGALAVPLSVLEKEAQLRLGGGGGGGHLPTGGGPDRPTHLPTGSDDADPEEGPPAPTRGGKRSVKLVLG